MSSAVSLPPNPGFDSMEIKLSRCAAKRRRALTIARGCFAATELLYVQVSHEGISGYGEAAAIDHGPLIQTAASSEAALSGFAGELISLSPGSVFRIETLAREHALGSAALAALDMACWDWLSGRAGLPLYGLLGLEPDQPPTSVTMGIEPLEETAEQVRGLIDRTGALVLKLMLGCEDGIEADKARYLAARGVLPLGTRIRVDANGGWSPKDAVGMIDWLADRGCELVEQPIDPYAQYEDLEYVHARRRIPIILDEPILEAVDVVRLAACCDGVNIKLMKCGGISGALRALYVARALGLSSMLGCFGESSVSISAAASLGSLLDYVDLDSHLNLDPDPAEGVAFRGGHLIPTEIPGHGARPRGVFGRPELSTRSGGAAS